MISKPSKSELKLSQIDQDFIGEDGPSRVLFDKALELAFLEDLGDPATDLTTDPLIQTSLPLAKATIYCKSSPAVIAGLPVIEKVFRKLDPQAIVTPLVKEGQQIWQIPVAIATVSGKTGALLRAERIALNLLQRMCAVATTTSQFVEKTKGFEIAILDTRKTTPGLRLFEKYAVSVAGGKNHRFGLNDAILIKDNHIQMAGSISQAVKTLRSQYPNKPLEVECTNLEEVQESLNLGINRILLDNMSSELVKEAICLIDKRSFIEVSGGINLKNISEYLLPGVNAISIGALTHSATSVDLSLEIENS
jgi:nicotinate-nucleotide pyrophosphorylase (carboxylating)